MPTTDGVYDVAVVGSGPAGYSAAVQASWAGMSTTVPQGFEAGGRLMLSDRVENYAGLGEGKTGPELVDVVDAMEEQAVRLRAEMRTGSCARISR